MIFKIFGAIMVIIGLFIGFLVYQAILPIVFGTKTKATIIAVQQVEAKYKKNGRKIIYDLPVFQFDYLNKRITVRDHNSVTDINVVNTQLYIYYSEKYGISRGFSAIEIVFSIISLAFIFFGIIALFKSK
ncbi:hypothetical protein J2787_000886 [Chryseobacterium rhizosphaerae]|uniref:DUF3592 domain-containing protein n=1 Tax=Chryseobacterium rhizosphaerae TaxID=395937 RepID=A0AAE3Y8E0_9FLAO|nr:hypothetical protein [Chryseobacterium rhizosphaerae]MDR6525516.1 hypothetical protein [Chryseobacterium rhizosphaerae]